MSKQFKTIGIFGKYRAGNIVDSLNTLIEFLSEQQCDIVIEENTASQLPECKLKSIPYNELGKHCDCVIVVGGDGSMLQAAHAVLEDNTPVIGINRGRLGFLTDIRPDDIANALKPILNGEYQEEERFLLSVKTTSPQSGEFKTTALNECVLLPGKYAHMISFDIEINQQFMCSQRADGLIVNTPTGSTAYALSGGGSILHPRLNAIGLVPMFPHTLSSRPIVVAADSEINITIKEQNETAPCISCDGGERMPVLPGGKITITQYHKRLRLIHPKEYNYYDTLRSKLGWEQR